MTCDVVSDLAPPFPWVPFETSRDGVRELGCGRSPLVEPFVQDVGQAWCQHVSYHRRDAYRRVSGSPGSNNR